MYIRVSKPSIEVAPEISVSPLPPGLKRKKQDLGMTCWKVMWLFKG